MRRPYAGPRDVSWSLYLDGRCVTSTSRSGYGGALAQGREALAAGRAARLERWEGCPHPQCDGHGKLVIYKRGRMYPEHKPCPQCAVGLGTFTHDESLDPS